MRKKLISFLLFMFITGVSFAQTNGYKFYSFLDSVKVDGFYNIAITPELNANIKTDYSDIRIVNDSGKWVPHVLHNPSQEITYDAISYDLKYKEENIPGLSTTLIIENSFEKISNIGLTITNTKAERFCKLSGSNDQKSWFVINDSILINPVSAEKKTENIFTIGFPPSSYRYLKIVINNKDKDPFDIKGIMYQSDARTAASYNKYKEVENPTTTILQKDSGKASYIKVIQQQPYQFDAISLQLSGVKYYNRQVELYIPIDEAHSFSNPGRLLHSFEVSNNSTLQFRIPLTKAAVFYLLIKNEDNLPLKVDTVNTSSSYRYITAYLEKGNNYRLIAENQDAILPEYDLSKINTRITDSIPYLGFGKIIAFDEIKPVVATAINNRWLLWSAIAVALLILLFFTAKMLKEVDKRKTT